MSEDHTSFVRVYLSIGGWKPCMMTYYADDQMFEPEFTGNGWPTREQAITEAEFIAKCEGVTFREDRSDPENEEGLSKARIAAFRARFPRIFT